MREIKRKTGICQISGRELPMDELVPVSLVREPILGLVKKDHPDWDPNGYISIVELNKLRHEHVERMLNKERVEMTHLEREVIKSLEQAEFVSRNIEADIDERLTLGQRVADRVAEFGGSWGFIIAFFAFFLVWILLNVYVLVHKPFDPYPFILLNLILSCIAAIQAPVIMMSQNRKEEKDRPRSEHDYQVNLKSELEIRHLHDKIDHLLSHQWDRLARIQEIQLDLLSEIGKK